MPCQKCGKDVRTMLCVDCFAEDVMESHGSHRLVHDTGHIAENRYGGDLVELGAIHALFEDMPASEVGVTSGAQSAFAAARTFIKEVTANQCRLAGCRLSGHPYGANDEHTDQCWFGIKLNYYKDRAVKHGQGN